MLIIKNTGATFLLMCCLLLQPGIVNAASVQQVSVDDLLDIAGLVFEGRATNVESRWNAQRSAINTYVTFDIVEVINGDYEPASIELSFSGGSADGLTMQVSGMIYPKIDEIGIYFIEETGRVFVNPIVGWSQGHFLIEKDSAGDERMHTAERMPITQMNDTQSSDDALSDGVAVGLKAARELSQGVAAMTKSQFKQALKNRLSSNTVR